LINDKFCLLPEEAEIGDGIDFLDLDDYNHLVGEGQNITESQTFVDEDNNVLDVLNIHGELISLIFCHTSLALC